MRLKSAFHTELQVMEDEFSLIRALSATNSLSPEYIASLERHLKDFLHLLSIKDYDYFLKN